MKRSINSHGLLWGEIIGFVYCLTLLLRYYTGANNVYMFSLWAFLGYIIVLILLLISGFNLRKKNGGYIELKEVFKSMFISVLIFELIYAIFNFIYLKYVNPNFFSTFKDSIEAMMVKANQPQDKIDEALNKIDSTSASKMNIFDLLKGYLFWIGISGLCAFLFALIIKRKRDPFREQQEKFLET
jgi:hypothetical protein